MSLSPNAPGAALRWERLSADRSLSWPVRPPAYSAVLGARMVVAFADANAATALVGVGADGVPAAIGPVPVAASGLCAAGDHLVLAGLRARDGKPVVLELDAGGKAVRELEPAVAGTLHRPPQPVCTTAGVRVVWEERGPGNASTLAWAALTASGLGAPQRHPWPERTANFAAAPDQAGVALLRDGGQPLRAAIYRITAAGVDAGAPLPAPAVGTPVASPDGVAVLIVATPQALQLATVDAARRAAVGPSPVVAVAPPLAVSGALLVPLDHGAWAIAAAAAGPDPSSGEVAAGEPPRREDFQLVAYDARSHAAGPPQQVGPPLAAAWLEGKLVLWTGRTSAAVSTWRLMP